MEALSDVEVGFLDQRQVHGGSEQQEWKAFNFDRVWGPESTQEDVFLDVEALALSVMEGENACIMAYGQTGSGKTYTMGAGWEAGRVGWEEDEEEEEKRGISHRLLEKMMELAKGEEEEEGGIGECEGVSSMVGYVVAMSMVEVYNDDVRDLLPRGHLSLPSPPPFPPPLQPPPPRPRGDPSSSKSVEMPRTMSGFRVWSNEKSAPSPMLLSSYHRETRRGPLQPPTSTSIPPVLIQ